ncbi:MAG: CinA family nicotinamide mononucleotide deamidase-related protein [Candidatus Rokubacteria bacterium]|nr:CinA family nicotinamide mononucleotide deamidase-related protein [Candidatus Rokubacteria bacterium]
MRAEIVSIGSELLLGQIVDTNAAFIARHLASVGLDLFQKVTVGDNLIRVAAVLTTALERAHVVITTGGLGPTADDVTREAAAQATGRRLVFVPELLQEIEAFFRARGFTLSPSNQKQAYVPDGAIPLSNPVGTAPCFIVERDDRALISLPGVPREMEFLLVNRVLPYLRDRYRLRGMIVSRILRSCGLGESRVGEVIGDYMATGANPTVGTMAHLGQVDIRIAAKADDEAAARALIAPVEAEIRRRLGDLIFGVDAETLEEVVAGSLDRRGWTLTLLEAGTGGLVAERLTTVPAAAGRVEALVMEADAGARRLGVTNGSAAELAEAARAWGKSPLAAATVIGAPEGEAGQAIYPTRIGVATGTGGEARAAEYPYRFGGDFRQVRVRAAVMTLDRLRRTLVTGSA